MHWIGHTCSYLYTYGFIFSSSPSWESSNWCCSRCHISSTEIAPLCLWPNFWASLSIPRMRTSVPATPLHSTAWPTNKPWSTWWYSSLDSLSACPSHGLLSADAQPCSWGVRTHSISYWSPPKFSSCRYLDRIGSAARSLLAISGSAWFAGICRNATPCSPGFIAGRFLEKTSRAVFLQSLWVFARGESS